MQGVKQGALSSFVGELSKKGLKQNMHF